MDSRRSQVGVGRAFSPRAFLGEGDLDRHSRHGRCLLLNDAGKRFQVEQVTSCEEKKERARGDDEGTAIHRSFSGGGKPHGG